jgi:hypothetical protein
MHDMGKLEQLRAEFFHLRNTLTHSPNMEDFSGDGESNTPLRAEMGVHVNDTIKIAREIASQRKEPVYFLHNFAPYMYVPEEKTVFKIEGEELVRPENSAIRGDEVAHPYRTSLLKMAKIIFNRNK